MLSFHISLCRQTDGQNRQTDGRTDGQLNGKTIFPLSVDVGA